MPSGNRWWPMDPRPEDVHIEDIAHNLARIVRFTGAIRGFYSVLQHSLFCESIVLTVAEEFEITAGCDEIKFEALMHDASEFALGDIARPIKGMIPGVREMLNIGESVIRERFGMPAAMNTDVHVAVKMADDIALVTERRDLMNPSPHQWQPYYESLQPWPKKIPDVMRPFDEVEHEFLERFYHHRPQERK